MLGIGNVLPIVGGPLFFDICYGPGAMSLPPLNTVLLMVGLVLT